MLKSLRILAVGRKVSPKTFVRIQLFLQIYLLATSILLLSVATQMLTGQTFSCPASSTAELEDSLEVSHSTAEVMGDFSDQLQEVTKRRIVSSSLDLMSVAGIGMLVYGLVMLPSSLLCVIIHSHCGYIATAACVRIHILMTLVLGSVCIYSLARVILLVSVETVVCGEERTLGLLTWLPALVPLYVAALVAHMWITYLLLTINIVINKSPGSPLPPKVVLHTSPSTSDHQTQISFTSQLGQAVHILKNPIDLIHGTNRHRLNSFQRLHVENSNSVILSEIPLTPHQNGIAPIDEKFDFDLPDAVTTVARPQYHQSTINQYLCDYQSMSNNRFNSSVEEL